MMLIITGRKEKITEKMEIAHANAETDPFKTSKKLKEMTSDQIYSAMNLEYLYFL